MQRLVPLIAPQSGPDFVFKVILFVVFGNLLAMGVVYSVHGGFPSGLKGQLIETTLIALPFALVMLRTIAYLYALQDELYHVAHTDVLTGLPNRRAFIEALEERLLSRQPGSLLVADADRFKRVNDLYGHEGGDICLQAIADHLRSTVDGQGQLSRIGGEEFAILVNAKDRTVLDMLGERLVAPVPFEVPKSGGELEIVYITLSVGGVTLDSGPTASHWLRIADSRLYDAKKAGRARFILEPESPERTVISAV